MIDHRLDHLYIDIKNNIFVNSCWVFRLLLKRNDITPDVTIKHYGGHKFIYVFIFLDFTGHIYSD